MHKLRMHPRSKHFSIMDQVGQRTMELNQELILSSTSLISKVSKNMRKTCINSYIHYPEKEFWILVLKVFFFKLLFYNHVCAIFSKSIINIWKIWCVLFCLSHLLFCSIFCLRCLILKYSLYLWLKICLDFYYFTLFFWKSEEIQLSLPSAAAPSNVPGK